MSMASEPRWKHSNAQNYSLENPISQLYERLRALPPMKSFIAHRAVIVCADTQQSDLLNSACFGRPILEAHGGLPGDEQISEDVLGETMLFELGLEEAFFLCCELKCLEVYRKGQQGEVGLNVDDLWQLMLERKYGFLYQYKAYSHLRMKNWIVWTGLQYGANFVAYRHHPSQVHAEYAVHVVPEGEEQLQLSSWSHLQGMIRLSGSVAKTLLILHIIPKELDNNNFRCLDLYSVQEVEVKRWLPKKYRMDSDTSNSKVDMM